jgi:hypothetical protein
MDTQFQFMNTSTMIVLVIFLAIIGHFVKETR